MNALVAKAYGDIEVLEYREMPDPPVGRREVKVKVAAAGINPIDWKLMSGARRGAIDLHFPAILGRDAAGEVIETGLDVNALKKGDRVLGLAWGTFAEQAVAHEDAWVKVPAGLEAKHAAALPLVLTTGAQLAEQVPLRKGLVVLVTGALGGVGRAAVYVARRAGAAVLAGVKRSQVEAARMLGVEGVVALDEEAELKKLPPLDAVCDTVGGETIAKLLPKLKKDGVVGSVLGVPPKAKELGLTVHAFMAQPNAAQLADLAGAVAQGELKIPVTAQFTLKDGARAIRFARDEAAGKVVLLP
jgi:NADPH:quinone reductase-like Zn-dependent oxidoreductase